MGVYLDLSDDDHASSHQRERSERWSDPMKGASSFDLYRLDATNLNSNDSIIIINTVKPVYNGGQALQLFCKKVTTLNGCFLLTIAACDMCYRQLVASVLYTVTTSYNRSPLNIIQVFVFIPLVFHIGTVALGIRGDTPEQTVDHTMGALTSEVPPCAFFRW